MKFGCHVSIKNGYFAAAKHAFNIGAKAFQYFPKNPRSLSVKRFNQSDAIQCFNFCKEHDLLSIAHTPYPTSLTPSSDKREITIASLLNDLEIAEYCGSIGVVVHFGHLIDKDNPLTSYQLMIEMINLVLSQWNGTCKLLIENNAGAAGALGTTLEELTQIRNLIDDPEKIGFCLDTCHAFASGLWSGDQNAEFWEKAIELGFVDALAAIHLNNSKYPLRSRKDRHANIFNNGYIESDDFAKLLQLDFLSTTPFVLETHQMKVSHIKRK
ncbi:deoxyribonuclease IV [Metabacillus schmidteae]|uniref:deoxyribonuclease IV n=1 Tax=Metabacillus schmidteae TaxID=2730405 RepID=UPI00158A7651|nr:deoxyribonuclease IV [Metabacillus schmidteae]